MEDNIIEAFISGEPQHGKMTLAAERITLEGGTARVFAYLAFKEIPQYGRTVGRIIDTTVDLPDGFENISRGELISKLRASAGVTSALNEQGGTVGERYERLLGSDYNEARTVSELDNDIRCPGAVFLRRETIRILRREGLCAASVDAMVYINGRSSHDPGGAYGFDVMLALPEEYFDKDDEELRLLLEKTLGISSALRGPDGPVSEFI